MSALGMLFMQIYAHIVQYEFSYEHLNVLNIMRLQPFDKNNAATTKAIINDE